MFRKKKDMNNVRLEKEWFIFVDNQPEGPYHFLDLKRDPRFTPDTLVWKKGFAEWIAARFVPELQDVFKDDRKSQTIQQPENQEIESELGQQSQVTLTMQQDPYQLFLWILALLLILFYTFYQFYK